MIIQQETSSLFERYVNFEFYETELLKGQFDLSFERYVNFEFYETRERSLEADEQFERYVNFEFYETEKLIKYTEDCLRDM